MVLALVLLPALASLQTANVTTRGLPAGAQFELGIAACSR